MASYLKNTYVDGSLVVEGDLKVKSLDLSGAQVPTIDTTDSFNHPGQRLVRTSSDYPSILKPSNFEINESVNKEVNLLVTSETFRGDNDPYQATAFNISLKTGQNQENLILTVKDNTENVVGAQHDFMACIPQATLYLWNQAKGGNIKQDPDYQWHFQPQTIATPGA